MSWVRHRAAHRYIYIELLLVDELGVYKKRGSQHGGYEGKSLRNDTGKLQPKLARPRGDVFAEVHPAGGPNNAEARPRLREEEAKGWKEEARSDQLNEYRLQGALSRA